MFNPARIPLLSTMLFALPLFASWATHGTTSVPASAEEPKATVKNATEKVPPQTGEAKPPAASIAFVLDVSGSMTERQKLPLLKESTKLAVALLDGELTLIPFSDSAQPSRRMSLTDAASRQTAMGGVEQLRAGGGTKYLSALQVLKSLPKGTLILFVSDGENNTGLDSDVLAALKDVPGPIYAIGIETTPKAQDLLTKMAAATKGSAVRVEHAEELTKHILKIAEAFGNYRSYTPKQTEVSFPGVQGNLVAIGYDAVPALDGTPALAAPLFQHLAKLPDEQVHVSRTSLVGRTDIRIQVSQRVSPQGRLAAILRNDLPVARTTLDTRDGSAKTGAQVVATTEFFDNQGNQIDPRNRADLIGGYLLKDQQGQTLAKVPAQPSPTKPALTGTLQLPNQPGPVVVVQGSRITTPAGQPFDAFQQQTILVKAPYSLAADPASLIGHVDIGKFRLSTNLKADRPNEAVPDSLQAVIQPACPGIMLLHHAQAGERLDFEFEATADGEFPGALEICAPGVTTVLPLTIPFHFTVKPRCLGLALPNQVQLGSIAAGVGRVQLPPIAVRSRDQQPVPYGVRLTDLSNGADVIPLTGSAEDIQPTTTQPASLTLSADVGPVSRGIYTGRARFTLKATTPPRTWEVPLRLVVTDPLVAEPLDFGEVEPGAIRETALKLRNKGPEVRNLSLTADEVNAPGGSIAFTVPDKVAPIAAQADAAIAVRLAVSPLVTARGPLAGTLHLRRPGASDLSIPVRLTLVGAGQGTGPLMVSPEEVRVTGAPGTVLQFSLSLKLGPDGPKADQLEVSATPLRAANGAAPGGPPEFRWRGPGNSITPAVPAGAQGFLVAPPAAGTYRGEITVSSGHAGQKTIPIIVTVR